MTSSSETTAPLAASDKFYISLTALRKHHLELKQTTLEALQDSKRAAEATESVRAFINRAAASGNLIGDENQRKSAQAIIDYWTTELASSPEAKDVDYAPAVLAPFDARSATTDGPDPKAPVTSERGRQSIDGTLAAVDEIKAAAIEGSKNLSQDQKQTREMIRLAATARLWRDAGKEPGFLLVGRAID